MPAGSETLESLPVVRPGTSPADLVRSEPNEDELHEYCVAIRRTARVFAKAHVKKGTLAEHDQYTVWVAMYMQLSGFGTFVIVDDSKDPGERGFVAPVGVHGGRVREGELAKVMRAEVLVGMLLAMGAGHKSTPKGGLNGLLEAALRGELTEEPSGKFGDGAYKDEPWSIVALLRSTCNTTSVQ